MLDPEAHIGLLARDGIERRGASHGRVDTGLGDRVDMLQVVGDVPGGVSVNRGEPFVGSPPNVCGEGSGTTRYGSGGGGSLAGANVGWGITGMVARTTQVREAGR